VTRPLSGTELKRLHREWRRSTTGRLALVLDGVQKPYNVGAVVRSAAAFSVDHLWLAGHVPPPDDAKVAKTALGSERFVPWTVCEGAAEALAAARGDGFRLVGIELAEGSLPLHDADLAGDVCLVVGHEDRGLSREALAGCDELAFIPQLGRIGSLNVATATAIALYEARRRAWTSAGTGAHDPAPSP
jgi:tRNA (guanosine-2'-O-)-methyltransferase